MLSWVKYLSQAGHQVHVLTVSNPSNLAEDESLANEIPAEVKIHKTKTVEPFGIYKSLSGGKKSNDTVGLPSKSGSFLSKAALHIRLNFFIPDPRIGWKRTAVRKGAEIIRKENIDVLISTSPPHSSQLIAMEIKKKTSIPWIADLRDPWTKLYHYDSQEMSDRVRKKHKSLERKVLQSADRIVTIGHKLAESFEFEEKEMDIIFNGYPRKPYTIEGRTLEGFQVSYIGNFSRFQLEHQLWSSLSSFTQHHPKVNITLNFIGKTHSDLQDILESNHLEDIVSRHGYQPHQYALSMMKSSDLLLLIIPRAADNELIITSKIFEYLQAEKPILGIGPVNGEAAQILSKFRHCGFFDYDDHRGIKEFIEASYTSTHSIDDKDRENIKFYSRSNQAKRLETIIKDLT